MNVIFKVIKYGGKEHNQATILRKEVLYQACGISADDYYRDNEDGIQIAGFDNDAILATCSLIPEEDTCRMCYVAIKSDIQGSGIGSKMLEFVEKQARDKGFESIYCNARDTAINFYIKNGYKTEGEIFQRVTIDHIKMRKVLR
jgi:phosphoribosylformimino-5-aminoimidazole carboxamide ribotide isomerase